MHGTPLCALSSILPNSFRLAFRSLQRCPLTFRPCSGWVTQGESFRCVWWTLRGLPCALASLWPPDWWLAADMAVLLRGSGALIEQSSGSCSPALTWFMFLSNCFCFFSSVSLHPSASVSCWGCGDLRYSSRHACFWFLASVTKTYLQRHSCPDCPIFSGAPVLSILLPWVPDCFGCWLNKGF